MACESFVEHLVSSILLITEVVPKIFPNLNVVGLLAVPAVRFLPAEAGYFIHCEAFSHPWKVECLHC